MKRQRCDIFRVADRVGIRLLRPDQHRTRMRRDKICFAKGTLRRIGRRHGEQHLEFVLRLIVESEGNAGALHSETINAVSDLIIDRPALVERGGRLFDQFDRVNLTEIRAQAKALGLRVPSPRVMLVILAIALERAEKPAVFPEERAA
jgi:hypothetical protein